MEVIDNTRFKITVSKVPFHFNGTIVKMLFKIKHEFTTSIVYTVNKGCFL